jgi:alpha-glucosidase
VPFYITWRPSANLAFGIFYDTFSDCAFDFGCERSAYHGLFRSFIADHGILDYYVIAGPSVAEVVRRFTWLTGRPALLPKWSLGYSASGMSYTEAPDAQEQMYKFLARCERHGVPCDSFHLSSGYTSVSGRRYLFHWNRDKFPDPRGLSSAFLQKGVRLCANLKPWLLRDHPRIKEARRLGLLIRETDGTPAWVQVWGGEGAYLDFTSRRTIRWWKEQVKTQLLERGIAATWNDNNEYEIKSPRARIEGFGDRRAAIEARPLQALLMTRASRDAQRESAPSQRPFVVTRSGGAGVQRYAQTWSGDNYTSWETLKYNLRMGLSLALCGVSNIGHDVGGFAGPKPDPELFLRWVQFGIFMPRFSIHSWNDDGTVNEPWMFPQITHHIRDLIRFRYRLLPYFYDLMWRYRRDFEPMVRPMFYDFPHDLQCYDESDQMMVGTALLAAPAVEPGIRSRLVYLPDGVHWYDFWSGRRLAGGQTVRLSAGLKCPPLLARAGSLVPANLARQRFDSRDDRRGFYLFRTSWDRIIHRDLVRGRRRVLRIQRWLFLRVAFRRPLQCKHHSRPGLADRPACPALRQIATPAAPAHGIANRNLSAHLKPVRAKLLMIATVCESSPSRCDRGFGAQPSRATTQPVMLLPLLRKTESGRRRMVRRRKTRSR